MSPNLSRKLPWGGLLLLTLLLPACARDRLLSVQDARGNYIGHPDPYKTRRMITGSNIPQPVNRPTFDPTRANVPLESFNRDRPGLTPTEPVVGAGDQSLYRLNEPSVGAGPAGSNPYPGNQ